MTTYYIGLDIHKKIIAYCIKRIDGHLVVQGEVAATRKALHAWLATIPGDWIGAMEATIFTGWVYDYLKPHAVDLKVAHPAMLKAITAAKKKNDRDDAERICDLLRVNLLPECYMLPAEIRELRRVLRYRNMMVRNASQMKNKISGLLMEVGEPYDKSRLHGRKYFYDLLERVGDVPESVKELLLLTRGGLEMFRAVQKKLIKALQENALIRERIRRLKTIRGVGEVLALTWVLETGESGRFRSSREAISYCGLCSAQQQSAGKERRGPISKKRNKYLQTMLVEAAHIAPHWNEQLAALHTREIARGSKNRATLAVERRGSDFEPFMAKAA